MIRQKNTCTLDTHSLLNAHLNTHTHTHIHTHTHTYIHTMTFTPSLLPLPPLSLSLTLSLSLSLSFRLSTHFGSSFLTCTAISLIFVRASWVAFLSPLAMIWGWTPSSTKGLQFLRISPAISTTDVVPSPTWEHHINTRFYFNHKISIMTVLFLVLIRASTHH